MAKTNGGGAGDERPADRTRRVVGATAEFKKIVLPYPRQQYLIEALNELRLTGLEAKGEPMDGLRLLERSGCGKTWGAQAFVRYVENLGEHEPGTKPVLLVRLRVTGTARSFYSSILDAIGDEFSGSGSEEELRKRVLKAFAIMKVQLLIVDEVQHLFKRAHFGRDVTRSLKDFLDSGVVPVAFLGTTEAEHVFNGDEELKNRMEAPFSLGPLDWADGEDRALFTDFISGLDREMLKRKIIARQIGLNNPKVARPLWEASGGIIGQTSRIVRLAMREAVRRGDRIVTTADLRTAIDRWSIPNGYVELNPFG